MLENLKKNNLLIAFSLIFILFFLSILIFESTWGINDDVIMAMSIYGKGFSNNPSEYIVYSNIIIGSALKKIYQTLPSHPWYGIYTFFILFTSFVVLLYSLLSYKYSITRIVYFLVYFVLFGLFFIRGPEFTTNASMIGISGAFLLLASLYDEKKNLSYKTIIVCILLLSLSSLIRMDSFFLVMILSLPLIILGIAKKEFNKQIIKKIIILNISLSVVVFACHIYDKAHYSKDNRWAYMFEKANLRGELIDYMKMPEYSSRTRHIFNKVGWGVNDLLLMGKWFSADDKVFDKDKMEIVLLEVKNIPTKGPLINFRYMLKDKYFYGAVLLIIFFILQINREKDKKTAIGVAISILVSLFIIIYLGHFVKLPNRVYMSIFSFLSFLTLFFVDNDIGEKSTKQLKSKFKFIFIFLFIGYFIFLHYKVSSFQKKGNFLLKYYIAQLHPTKEHVFLVWAKSLPFELISVFDNLDDFSEFRMLPINHRFNDPVSSETLKDFNVKTFGELIEKDNLYHIGNLTYMALYSQYLKEHYNLDAAFKVYIENPIFMVYKTSKITPEISNKLMPISVKIMNISYKVFLYGNNN
ncbi:MAG: hypothetical protein HY752_01645 [Nitrospirae bacterium]|nr:hypothetical protein [Nitrospirota bacterium]